MSYALLTGALTAAHVLLGLAMLCAAYRLIIGPRAQDRVLALDTLYVNGMLLVLTVGMRLGEAVYFEVALCIAALGSIATAAAAKFLMRGEVVE